MKKLHGSTKFYFMNAIVKYVFQFGRFKAVCRMCRLFFFCHARIGNKE
ncbi:unnamed protein product, partial [Tenebrio molitor]